MRWACSWHASTSIRSRIFLSVRIKAGSRFKRFLCFVLIYVRWFPVSPELRFPVVKNYWFREVSLVRRKKCMFVNLKMLSYYGGASMLSIQKFKGWGLEPGAKELVMTITQFVCSSTVCHSIPLYFFFFFFHLTPLIIQSIHRIWIISTFLFNI
jgi:hypothetical protein